MGTWDYYGKHDPYYGVLSHEEFRGGALDAAAREKFFASGVGVVEGFLSSAMLEEAGRNMAYRPNVSYELATSQSSRPVDFVLSKIVFQHIPPREALRILGQLAARLTVGGVGILDLPVRYTAGTLRRALSTVRTMLPSREPVIPLHIHDLDKVRAALSRSGCDTHHQLIQTPLFEKAVVIFRRQA